MCVRVRDISWGRDWRKLITRGIREIRKIWERNKISEKSSLLLYLYESKTTNKTTKIKLSKNLKNRLDSLRDFSNFFIKLSNTQF